MTTDANTGSGTSNGTVFLMDTTMPNGTDNTDVSQYVSYKNVIDYMYVSITLNLFYELGTRP